jgi:hypothetical protein
MPAYNYKMKPGETMFGGGAGVLFLGRGSRPAADVHRDTQQAPNELHESEPPAGDSGTPVRQEESNQNAAVPTSESKSQ